MAVDVTMRIRAEDQASGVLAKVGGVFSNILQGAASFIAANVIQRGAAEIFNFAKSSIDAASNLGETINKVNEIFEDSSQGILDWSENAATSVGLSQQGALDAAASMAIFGKAAGLAGEDLNEFATDNVGMAADMASFFNTSVEDAAQALGAAFRGEAEPIRRYGVLLNDAVLKEKALELGIISNTKNALTPQQKVLAANAVITDQLSDAQGDFARTSDGLANSQRILKAQMENVKTELGTAFLPLVTQFVGFVSREGVPIILDLVGRFKEWFKVIGESDITGVLMGIVDVVKGLFSGEAGGDGGIFGSVQAFFDFLGNWWTLNGAPLVENFKSMGAATGEVFGKIVADIKPLIDEVLTKVAAWMLENGPLIQGVFAQLASVWNELLMPAIMIAWETIKPILTGLIDLILGVASIFLNVVAGDWAGAWEALKNTAASVGEALIQAVTNLLDGILGLFGTNLAEVTDVMAGWINDAIAWGKNLVDGIKTGISNAWSGLKSWFQGLWDDLVGGVKDFLGMQSPSKVFADIGTNMMTGLAEGIGSGATVPVNAMMDATSGIVNAVPAGAAGATTGGAGYAPTIVVNIQSPVTVMDEVNAVEHLRKYVGQAYRQLRAEGAV